MQIISVQRWWRHSVCELSLLWFHYSTQTALELWSVASVTCLTSFKATRQTRVNVTDSFTWTRFFSRLSSCLSLCGSQWFSVRRGVPKGQRHEPGGERWGDPVSGGWGQNHLLIYLMSSVLAVTEGDWTWRWRRVLGWALYCLLHPLCVCVDDRSLWGGVCEGGPGQGCDSAVRLVSQRPAGGAQGGDDGRPTSRAEGSRRSASPW